MKKIQENIFWIIAGIAVLVFIGFAIANSNKSGDSEISLKTNSKSADSVIENANLDEFTVCLGERGAKFYGAYWCSFCNAQKDLFADSAELIPYVECAVEGEDGQTKICQDANIQSYPTWIFADGTQDSGVQSLEKLASKTGCALLASN